MPKMRAVDAAVLVLEKEGIDTAFGVPGAAINPLYSVSGFAVGLLVVWLLIYLRVSAPINRRLTAAADQSDPSVNARELQHNWDRVITIRAVLQGLAVTALCTALLT